MKAIIASLAVVMPVLTWAAAPTDIENVTIPYAGKTAISCGSLQVCDLEFQAGESIIDFKLTDTQNWSINPATTGADSKKVQHLIVMPVSAGLKSPLVVTTDRRRYEVTLESNSYILASRKIAFSYQTPSDKITDISKLESFVRETPKELAMPSQPVKSAPMTLPAPAAPVAAHEITPAPSKDDKPVIPVPRTWALKPEYRSLRDVIEDWASTAGKGGGAYEVIWETRDFPLVIKQKKTIHSGDFWEALRILGEAYRNSDAPFQIQPTAFEQLVVQPMNKAQQ